MTCTLLKGLYYTRVEGIRGEAEGAGGTLRVRSVAPRTGEEGTRDATCQIRAKLLRDGGRGKGAAREVDELELRDELT